MNQDYLTLEALDRAKFHVARPSHSGRALPDCWEASRPILSID